MISEAGKRIRRHGKWLLTLASAIIGILICEGAVRWLELAPPMHAIWLEDDDSFYQQSTDPLLRHVLKTNHSRDFAVGPATSNSHGLRDIERSVTKPTGTRRIIVLGDSIVEGINYNDDEHTISRQLEKLYAKDNEPVEVLNFGTAGYCTLSEVALLERKGLAFAPDRVVLVFCPNDYNNFNPIHATPGGTFPRPEWSKHLFLRSEFFRVTALQLNWFGFRDEASPSPLHHAALGENNVVTGLNRLRELANEHGFEVLIAAWPVFTDHAVLYRTAFNDGKLLIERLARMNDLPVAKLGGLFAQSLARIEPPPNPRHHLTVRGDRMHPNAIATGLCANYLKSILDQPLPAPPYAAGSPDPEAIELARLWSAPVPGQMDPQQQRIQALIHQARREEAVAQMQDYLRQFPNHPSYNARVAFHLFEKGEMEQCLPYFFKLTEIDPTNENARSRFAFALNHCMQTEGAHQVLQIGLQLNPESANLHVCLALVSTTNANHRLAQRHLDLAVSIDSTHPEIPKLEEQLKALKARQKSSN